jgi:hypothetical protein
MILVQDTKFVKQTRDLGNIFGLVGGMKFDSSKSSDQTKVYNGVGTILSIKDYNDDSLITRCISQGCAYNMNCVLTITPSSKSL